MNIKKKKNYVKKAKEEEKALYEFFKEKEKYENPEKSWGTLTQDQKNVVETNF